MLALGGETLVERAKIDHHSLMKAVADLFRLVAGRNLEFDSLPFDLDDLGFGSNLVAHRRSGKVPDIYRSAHRALAHIQKWPDGIEGCVFHDQDHNRGRQHLRGPQCL